MISSLLFFITSSLILAVMPGPDIIFVVTQAIIKGKKEALCVSFGLGTGCIFHATLASFGIAYIFQQSVLAFNLLKYFGVIYLLFLAYKTFVNSDKDITAEDKNIAKLGYIKGILMNILNPKVILFFLAFLPQFVPSNINKVEVYMFFLGFVFMLISTLVFCTISILASPLNKYLLSNTNLMVKVKKISALILGLLAILLASMHQT